MIKIRKSRRFLLSTWRIVVQICKNILKIHDMKKSIKNLESKQTGKFMEVFGSKIIGAGQPTITLAEATLSPSRSSKDAEGNDNDGCDCTCPVTTL